MVTVIALSAWLLVNVGVLLLACVAYLRRRHEPVLIEDAAPIFPHDHPIACLGCGRVHKGACLNAAIWEAEL